MAPEKLSLVLIIITTFLLLFFERASGLDRCQDYLPLVRNASIQFLGPNYPYHYNLGQLQQESRCRNVVSFDMGRGLAQFMDGTAKYVNKIYGTNLDPMNPEHAIKLQAMYMSQIEKKENFSDRLWISYQIYNGGRKTLYQEYEGAGEINWNKMKDVCKRRVITLKNGSKLDMCEVNYDYSMKIYRYGNQYRTYSKDGRRFW